MADKSLFSDAERVLLMDALDKSRASFTRSVSSAPVLVRSGYRQMLDDLAALRSKLEKM